MNDSQIIKIVENPEELEDAFMIRDKVFIKEQGVTEELEMDGLDKSCDHIIFYINENPIGTARIRYANNKAKLERISILKEYRGQGHGKNLLQFLVDFAKGMQVDEIYMHAQSYLINYYKKLGFTTRGEEFIEANIRHIEMFMKI